MELTKDAIGKQAEYTVKIQVLADADYDKHRDISIHIQWCVNVKAVLGNFYAIGEVALADVKPGMHNTYACDIGRVRETTEGYDIALETDPDVVQWAIGHAKEIAAGNLYSRIKEAMTVQENLDALRSI